MYTAQTHIDSPLGQVLLARTALGLAGLWFTQGQRDFPGALAAPTQAQDPLFQQVEAQLQRYWTAPMGSPTPFEVPLDFIGTPFQQAVWRALLDITHGQVCSYGDLARRLDSPNACRAVGMAVGRNPVSIIVPCHRVMGSSLQLTGYSGGLQRKTALLIREGHLVHGQRLQLADHAQGALL